MIPMQRAQAPRPGQNADGQRKQPIQSSMAPQGQSPFPATMGPGVPGDLQSFPTDMGSLELMMRQGFAPGANDMQHADAQNAYAMARAQEQQANMQNVQQMEDDDDMAKLGPLMRRVMERRGQAGAPQAAPPQGAY